MAAPMRKCSLCLSIIKSKNYRSLESVSSVQQYDFIFSDLNIKNEGVACGLCTNKLNRIVKLNSDKSTIMSRIQQEQTHILSYLREMPGVKQLKIQLDKSSTSKKRPLPRTPSGATPRSKRSLFVTPKRTSSVQKQNSVNIFHRSTQTHSTNSEYDVKVCVKYQGNERSRIIGDKVHQSVLKAILNKKGQATVVKHLAKDPKYMTAFVNVIAKQLIKEVSELQKRKETTSKLTSVKDMLNFDWKTQLEELKVKLPTLMSVLNPLFGKKLKNCIPKLVVGVCVLLYARCQQLNLIQYILGLTLDTCGLNKEGLNIVHDLGLSVSYSSVNKKRKSLVKQQEENINSIVRKYVSQTISDYEKLNSATDGNEEEISIVNSVELSTDIDTDSYETSSESLKLKPIEVIGDNLDISIAPAKMTMDKQRQSLHWFLTMVKQRRITYEAFNTCVNVPSQIPILDVCSYKWIPSNEQIKSIQENFVFHVSKTLIKYINFIQPVKEVYPEYIAHTFMDITKEKSVILNCDLIDASENSSQGMIEILQKVYELTVPHTQGAVIQKVVFGGDVLTNERAFSAQEAMQNNNSSFDNLCGVVHRPEGLHRQFNFLQVIQCPGCSTVSVES